MTNLENFTPSTVTLGQFDRELSTFMNVFTITYYLINKSVFSKVQTTKAITAKNSKT